MRVMGDAMRHLVLICALAMPGLAAAQEFNLSYLTAIGPQDLFNTRGARLDSAAGVLRQDRANYHRFAVRQPQDEWDPVLHDSDARDAFEDALDAAGIDPATEAAILSGGALVLVELRRGTGVFDYARVAVLGETP